MTVMMPGRRASCVCEGGRVPLHYHSLPAGQWWPARPAPAVNQRAWPVSNETAVPLLRSVVLLLPQPELGSPRSIYLPTTPSVVISGAGTTLAGNSSTPGQSVVFTGEKTGWERRARGVRKDVHYHWRPPAFQLRSMFPSEGPSTRATPKAGFTASLTQGSPSHPALVERREASHSIVVAEHRLGSASTPTRRVEPSSRPPKPTSLRGATRVADHTQHHTQQHNTTACGRGPSAPPSAGNRATQPRGNSTTCTTTTKHVRVKAVWRSAPGATT